MRKEEGPVGMGVAGGKRVREKEAARGVCVVGDRRGPQRGLRYRVQGHGVAQAAGGWGGGRELMRIWGRGLKVPLPGVSKELSLFLGLIVPSAGCRWE